MSTLTLKNLPATVVRLQAMIRAGKSVRITDGGRTVATLKPVAEKQAARGRRKPGGMSASEWLARNPPPGPPRPDLNMGEIVRKARLAEG